MFTLGLAVFASILISVNGGDHECAIISYKLKHGWILRYTQYMYCEEGCCGTTQDRFCCAKDRVDTNHTGMYVGIGAAAAVLIVLIIAVTCCCISKYNKKNVVVGIQPQPMTYRNAMYVGIQPTQGNTHHRNGLISVQNRHGDGRNYYGSPPPAYEAATAPGSTDIHYSNSSGKMFL